MQTFRIACRRIHSAPGSLHVKITQKRAPSVFTQGIAADNRFIVPMAGVDGKLKRLKPERDSKVLKAGPLHRRLAESIRSNSVLVFFPRGYPHSVTGNYWDFTKWHFIASICGTVNGVLGMQALLSALGMGTGALPVAATINWIIKDGFGLLGGVLYTSMFSNRFDVEPKRYRFKASLAFQMATVCELLTPLVPGLFVVLASLANIAKNIAWLTMSGCRAQMHQSFCLRDNLGDITAKAGSQSTAAGLLGTGLGVVVTSLVGGSVSSSFMVFAPLSMISLYSLSLSNSTVVTDTFNIQRAELVFKEYFDHGRYASPAEVAERESFIRKYHSVFGRAMVLNPSLKGISAGALISDLNAFKKYPYVISDDGDKLKVWIKEGVPSRDVLKAMFHASVLRSGRPWISDEFETVYEGLEQAGWTMGEISQGDFNRISYKID
eukprot:Partr_v1_DN27041_c0_g1_i3_m29378 putative Chromosome 16 open reading frame 58